MKTVKFIKDHTSGIKADAVHALTDAHADRLIASGHAVDESGAASAEEKPAEVPPVPAAEPKTGKEKKAAEPKTGKK